MERADLASLVMATGCAEQCGEFTFLVDPQWTPAQHEAFSQLKQSKVEAPHSKIKNQKSKIQAGWLCIPTGGSSGGLRFARHDEQTLGAAVRGFCAHFAMTTVNAIDVLPPWHVSGLLARVRCAATCGQHVAWTWKQLEAGVFPETATGSDWVLSLVPTQLQRMLGSPPAVTWLRSLRLILIGGGPAWPDLIESARNARLPLVFSYGMTETAAMVAAQSPGDFAQGGHSSGCALPHARIEILDEQTGAILPAGSTGIVRITGESVMRGYFPETLSGREFVTADRGRLDADGCLHIIGRRDDVVITGGEKVNPREIEAVLRSAGAFADVAVIGIPHEEWGEELVACYTGKIPAEADQVIDRQLSRHQRPKRYLAIAEADWPRNAQGKVNRAALRELALRHPRG